MNARAESAKCLILRRFLPVLLLYGIFIFAFAPVAEAITSCRYCNYPVASDALTCPKCLRKLQWPIIPERSHSARVVVRTGSDAFIRHPHARIRQYRDDRNSGGDNIGHIGSWGGPTTLRYLLRFDIPQAFAMAQVDMQDFNVRRALLKLCVADHGKYNGVPVRIYLLTRPFAAGTGLAGVREKKHDGCDWYHSAPLIVWHREGGDYAEKPSVPAILGEDGENETIIDITELIKARFDEYAKTGVWNDHGLLIMRDVGRYGYHGYVTIHSLEASFIGQTVRSPELFIH
ncbi:MAG: hypothetical protein GX569_09315 [Candidatus Riflebacteria bacterium]|nr:hypothetical protein [Candidatus Riflebacteria bacterium]